jgi:hypothetical protein
MKTISGTLNTHLNSPATTLARCWHIVRTDGTQFFFTSHDVDLPITSGEFAGHNGTYLSSVGFSATATANNSDLSVDNLDVEGVFDNASITDNDLRSGLFDYADIYVFVVNWADLTQGPLKLRRGKLGEVVASPQGWFHVELRGMTQLLQQKILELYGPECRADLGDARCKIPLDPPLRQNSTLYTAGTFIKVSTAAGPYYSQYQDVIYECTTTGTTAGSQPAYDTTVGHTTTDGSAVFTTVTAWTRDAVVATVTDQTHFTITVTEPRAIDGWYNYGILTWESGNNTGRNTEIKSWLSTGAHVELRLSAGYLIQVGDKLHISPGCNKSLAACRDKFANLDNMRAESYLPGNDQVFLYPDAQ